jgi:hypothetical protein
MDGLARQEILSILITFAVGFVAGGYLYLNNFTKLVSPDDVETLSDTTEFTIVSEAYGSCNEYCPAFQIQQDGSYRYRYTPNIGAEALFVNGTLPLDLQRSLSESVDTTDLKQQSESVNPIDCASFTEGIDISYTITFEGVEYEIDSCGTNYDGDSDLWAALGELWTYFRTVK